MEKKNYPAIDIVKFLCAMLILCYHYCSDFGPVHPLVEDFLSLYAVAVALFMTLSGFLLFAKLNTISDKSLHWNIVKSQVKRIMTIYLLWSVPYLFFTISTWDWTNLTATYVLWKIQGWIFNSTFYTIWFMPALAVGLLFAYLLYSRLSFGKVCIIAAIFYALGSLQVTYRFAGNLIPGFRSFAAFSNTWLQGCRGGIFFGMPMIVVGIAASKIPWRRPVFWGTASVVLMMGLLGEALILRRFVGGCGLDLALFMPAVCLAAAMFLVSVKLDGDFRWMRSMSTLIFMSQRLFLTVIPEMFPGVQLLLYTPYLGLVAAVSSVVLFSAAIIALRSKYSCIKYLY